MGHHLNHSPLIHGEQPHKSDIILQYVQCYQKPSLSERQAQADELHNERVQQI